MDTGLQVIFKLPPLPYAHDALEPHMSAATLGEHHGAHHKAYVEKLNGLIEGTEFAVKSLEEIIAATSGKKSKRPIFNNAAQHWNHSFFWRCLTPDGGGRIPEPIERRIAKDFGTVDAFKKEFVDQGVGHFGSGWVWVIDEGNKFAITTTHDGDNPVAHGQKALLTCDLWEHAYYLDYKHERPKFLKAFIDQLANWQFALSQLSEAGENNVAQANKGYAGA